MILWAPISRWFLPWWSHALQCFIGFPIGFLPQSFGSYHVILTVTSEPRDDLIDFMVLTREIGEVYGSAITKQMWYVYNYVHTHICIYIYIYVYIYICIRMQFCQQLRHDKMGCDLMRWWLIHSFPKQKCGFKCK